MTREQLQKQLAGLKGPTQRVRMRGTNLADTDFSNLDLTGADLSLSNLARARFDGAVLRGANLSFANLTDATFRNADLTNASLNFCSLSGADLTGAQIEGLSMSFSSRPARGCGSRPQPEEPLTLTALLRQRSGWGLGLVMLLGALLMYGVSGIIFFTNLILTTGNSVEVSMNQFIIVQNVTSGVLAALMTSSLSPWLDRLPMGIWQRHVWLSFLISIAWVLLQGVEFSLFNGPELVRQLRQANPAYDQQLVPWYLYVIGPLLIGNLFYYIQRQGRQLTRKLSEQEFQLLNLEKLKTRAELDALQAKINPHFLYNALNSIASLVHEEPDKAEKMTLLLSKLFRYTTGRDGSLFTTLACELEMVRTYLEVEQVRFGDRLQFSVDVADDALTDLKLPQFLLQPIVENAVKHGIARRADGGRIDVRLYAQQGWLCLSVHDNGPAFSDEMGGGYGLRSIQEKLRLLYGDDARIELRNQPEKQVLIQLNINRLTPETERLVTTQTD